MKITGEINKLYTRLSSYQALDEEFDFVEYFYDRAAAIIESGVSSKKQTDHISMAAFDAMCNSKPIHITPENKYRNYNGLKIVRLLS